MTPRDTWENGAYQLTKYHGCDLILASLWKELSSYTGEILEAMCGHISYFAETENTSVTALDYCRASLERYPFPKRRRVCCDLDRIRNGTQLPFETAQFDVVSICFGFKYPEDIHSLGREFRRIIKPGGTLSFIENPTHQYQALIKRQFSPELAQEILLSCGFKSVKVKTIPIRDRNLYTGEFFHTEAFV
jgi:SAM-dependent methyltransferase